MCMHDADWLSAFADDRAEARQIGSILRGLPGLQAIRERAGGVTFVTFARAARHPQARDAAALRCGIG